MYSPQKQIALAEDSLHLILCLVFTTPNAQKFKLLGSQIQFDQAGTGDLEISARVEAGLCKFAQLRQLLTNRYVKMSHRMKFYDAHVKSRMTYACQTWNLTLNQKWEVRLNRVTLLHMLEIRVRQRELIYILSFGRAIRGQTLLKLNCLRLNQLIKIK